MLSASYWDWEYSRTVAQSTEMPYTYFWLLILTAVTSSQRGLNRG